MKLKALSAAILSVAVLAGCQEKPVDVVDQEVNLETLEQKVSYMMGLQFGTQMASGDFDLNQDTLVLGLADGLNGEEPLLSDEEMQAVITEFQTVMQEKQMLAQQEAEAERALVAEESRTASTAFLTENAMRDGVITTDSGLQYEVIVQGDGEQATPDSIVTVNYKGTLVDGTVFDASELHGGPATFGLNQVIPGWTEGVALMNVGSTYKLFIPSDLAYGEFGSGDTIPPESALIFEIELLDVEAAQ